MHKGLESAQICDVIYECPVRAAKMKSLKYLPVKNGTPTPNELSEYSAPYRA